LRRWDSGSSLGYSMLELRMLAYRPVVYKGQNLPFAAEAEGDLFHLLGIIAGAGRGGGHDRSLLGRGCRCGVFCERVCGAGSRDHKSM